MSDNQTPQYTEDAKKIVERESLINLVDGFLAEKSIHFKDVDEEILKTLGIPQGNIYKCMKVIAHRLIGLYGIKKRELRNQKQIKLFGVSEKHLSIMERYIEIDQHIGEFARKINGERIMDGGETIGEIPAQTSNDYTQNIVQVDDKLVNQKLIDMYAKTIVRLDQMIEKEIDPEKKEQNIKDKAQYEKEIETLKSKKTKG